MRIKSILGINALVVGIVGFVALFSPGTLADVYFVSAANSSLLLLQFIGVLLIVAAIVSWLTADAGDVQTRGALFLAFAFGWILIIAVLLLGMDSGVVNTRSWGPIGIAALFVVGFLYAWEITRGVAWRIGEPMSNREILVWILTLVSVVTLLFAILMPVIWHQTVSRVVPAGISSLGTSAELIVALAAVGIGLAGVGTYTLVKQELSSAMTKQTIVTSYRAIAIAQTELGLNYWRIYTGGGDHSPADDPPTEKYNYLDQAIKINKRSLDVYCKVLDPKKKNHAITILGLENNLAYYLIERQKRWLSEISPADADLERETASKYVKELVEAVPDFPSQKDTWEDTIRFVEESLAIQQQAEMQAAPN